MQGWMPESQITRIKKADQAAQDFIQLPRDIRHETEQTDDPDLREELLASADGFETEARKLADALREWRKDIP